TAECLHRRVRSGYASPTTSDSVSRYNEITGLSQDPARAPERPGPLAHEGQPQVFNRPALFGPLTVTAGLFPAQVASRPTTFRDTSRGTPDTAVLLLNTRSRPTWLSPTMSADGPKNPTSAVLPVMTMSRPTVFACRASRAQMLPMPNPSVTERFVMLKS